LYEEINDYVNAREEKLYENYYTCQNYFRDNKDFMSDLWAAKPLNYAVIDYFMNDPIYLNWIYVMHHYFIEHQRSLRTFVNVANDVRNQIVELKLEEK